MQPSGLGGPWVAEGCPIAWSTGRGAVTSLLGDILGDVTVTLRPFQFLLGAPAAPASRASGQKLRSSEHSILHCTQAQHIDFLPEPTWEWMARPKSHNIIIAHLF